MKPGAQGSDQHAPREPDTGSTRDAPGGSTGRRSPGAIAAGMGLQFVISVLVFLLLGQWLDRRLGTAPAFLLVCVFVGAGGSFYAMYRAIMAAQRREDEAHASERRRAESDGPGAGGAA